MSVSTIPRGTVQALLRGFLCVWILGTGLFFAVQTFRLVRFARRLGRFCLRCDQLDRETAAIAVRLGLTRYPEPRLVDGVVSPMLWGVGRAARVLFPAELFEQLNADARGTLLMHELAHFRRGDHWVRVLEFAVTTLFWWHPVVWWALREIESAEEDCCDSWVMQRSASSPKCYATALLDTIDFLCERHPLAPPVASGLGNPTELRGRLVRIMTGTAQATLSPVGRLLVWSLVVFLPVQPEAFARIAASFGELMPRAASPTKESPTDAAIPKELVAATTGDSRLLLPPVSPAVNNVPATPPVFTKSAKEWARAVSPDGRFHIVARSPGRVELQDVRQSRTVDLTEAKISAVAFVPGTSTFITGGLDRQIRWWDAQSGRELQTLGEHPDQVRALAVSMEGLTLVSGSSDGTVIRWALDAGAPRLEQQLSLSAPVNCLRFSPDGRTVVVATGSYLSAESGGLVALDLATWTVRRRIALPAPIGAADYSEDGQVLVAGAWNGTVYYVSAADHNVLLSVVSSKDPISAAQFSADTHAFPVLSLAAAQAQLEREREERAAAEQAALNALQQLQPVSFTTTVPQLPAER
jgi:beta-lactamase regulating signal transducer with metallopeptidase domain